MDYKQLQDFKPVDPKEMPKSYLSVRVFKEYDCAEIRYRHLIQEYFSDNMGKGDLILEWKATWFEAHKNNGDWEDARPDSIGMAQLKSACKK